MSLGEFNFFYLGTLRVFQEKKKNLKILKLINYSCHFNGGIITYFFINTNKIILVQYVKTRKITVQMDCYYFIIIIDSR